jgi:hypothetical protein
MQLLKQSETEGAKTEILVVLRDDTTNLTAQTGVTASAGDIKIGKGNAAEANHAGTWTEIALGRYTYRFTAGELGTLGVTHFAFKKTGVREFVKEVQVVPWDPYLNQDTALNTLQSDVTAIGAKTTNLPASPAAVGSAMTLTSGERDAVADAQLDRTNGVEAGLTVRNALRLALAALAGKVSGATTGSGTVVIRNAVADSKNRISAVHDSSGNRTSITVDLT